MQQPQGLMGGVGIGRACGEGITASAAPGSGALHITMCGA